MFGLEWLLGLASVCLFLLWWWQREGHLPPGPISWPLVGYLPHLGPRPYLTLHRLTQKYGPVFCFYLCRRLVVVLGSLEAVKEALSNQVILDRPENPPNHLMPDSTSLSVSNGRAWREQRRFSIQALRDLGMSSSRMEGLIQGELSKLIDVIDSKSGQPFNLDQFLLPSISNIMVTLLTGSAPDFSHPDRRFLDRMLRTMVLFFRPTRLHAYCPALRPWLARLKIWGYDRAERCMEEFSHFIVAQIEDHKKSMDNNVRRDYINSYLSALQSKKNDDSSFSERMLKGNIQSLLGAGSTPSRAAVQWCVLAAMRHPDVQSAVHRELDAVLPRDQPITWKDRHALPYTLAVVYEVLRHHSIVPIPLLRCTAGRTRVGGYDVPKDTIVMPNIWSVHHDPRHWEEPFAFRPDRFLREGKAVRPPAFIAFSYGKRNCPGEDLAMALVFTYFATLMQRYVASLPDEGSGVRRMHGVANLLLLENVCFTRRV